jgi:pimeloyl-ACP methyl ester carboxylesterase
MVFPGFMSSSAPIQSHRPLHLRRKIAILLLVCASLMVSGCAWHRQPTLPYVFQGAQTLEGRRLPNHRDYWTAFRAPSRFNATGLYLLEPYQPDRIPLILIHGLASDALTWDETIMALKSHPDVSARYQIWCYQYPTGNSYLKAAADLRQELIRTRLALDPSASNPAFDQTVLVGHSMGGLVAKLQASHSDDKLWRAISHAQLNEISSATPVPNETASAILFDPVPFVKKVVYIATPQHGSNWTVNAIGRFGQWLIEIPEQVQGDYIGLVRGDPGWFSRPVYRPPTSIDHLYPGSSIMRAMSQLRKSDRVSAHSIIGTGYLLPDGYTGDGVVAVASARVSDVQTEFFVQATHSGILRNPVAASELVCILTRLP